jgi:hypothetical protein
VNGITVFVDAIEFSFMYSDIRLYYLCKIEIMETPDVLLTPCLIKSKSSFCNGPETLFFSVMKQINTYSYTSRS